MVSCLAGQGRKRSRGLTKMDGRCQEAGSLENSKRPFCLIAHSIPLRILHKFCVISHGCISDSN